jgi:hypothetical protein
MAFRNLISRVLHQWLSRHQHPVSRVLHGIGIPMLIFALLLGAVQLWQWRWDLWWRPVGLIVLSYLLQWIGHRAEGNDVGEIIFIKKLLRLPYVIVSPRYPSQDSPAPK